MMPEENRMSDAGTDDKMSSKGKLIVAVIVGGALYVGISPFIGAMLGPDHSRPQAPPVQQTPTQMPPMPAQLVTPVKESESTTGAASSGGLQHSTILEALQSTTRRDSVSQRFADSLSSKSAPTKIVIPEDLLSRKTEVVAASDFEGQLKNITSLCKAHKNEKGLREADKFLAALDQDGHSLPEYKIVTTGLAMQMALDLHQTARAKSYGDIGVVTSRAHDDYFMERIEPLYYQAQGSKVDFERAESLIEQCQAQLASGTKQKLPALGREVMAATSQLPESSFYRLQARVMNAYGEFVGSSDAVAAVANFEAIKQTAERAGDKAIARKCDAVVALIKKEAGK